MSLNRIAYHLTKNRCYQQAVKRTAIGIQLHTIGAAQGTAKSVADYWNQAAVSACVHYIVDCDTPGKVLATLPESFYAWADAGYGNRNLITFEICESDHMKYTGGADYTVTNEAKFRADIRRGYDTAVELCADICARYGWDPLAKLPSGLYLISSHDEGRRAGLSSAHVDPTHVWSRLGLTMDGFRSAVGAALKERGAESGGNPGGSQESGTGGSPGGSQESGTGGNPGGSQESETGGSPGGSQESGTGGETGAGQYIVQAGSFRNKTNAEKLFRKIKKAGFNVFVKKQDGEYKVRCGVFFVESNAKAMAEKLKEAGFQAFISGR